MEEHIGEVRMSKEIIVDVVCPHCKKKIGVRIVVDGIFYEP